MEPKLATTFVLPGFALPSTKLNSIFKLNPLHPSATDADFILCFRFHLNPDVTAPIGGIGAAITPGSVEKTFRSAAYYNVMFLNGGLSAKTRFRFSLVNNGWIDDNKKNIGLVAPILLRVAGLLEANDNESTNNEITVFLDNAVTLSSILYADEYKNLCISTGSAAISCSSRKYNTDVNIVTTKYYYYPVMQRLNI